MDGGDFDIGRARNRRPTILEWLASPKARGDCFRLDGRGLKLFRVRLSGVGVSAVER